MRHFMSRRAGAIRGVAIGAFLLVTGRPSASVAAAPQQPISDQVRLALAQQTMQPLPSQTTPGAPQAGTPAAPVAPGASLPLSLGDAIARGLEHNLNILLSEAGVENAEGVRFQALTTLLPSFSGNLGFTRQKLSLDQFGFTFPGFPKLIGPFNVYDARVSLSQSVVDVSAIAHLRSRVQSLQAAKYTAQDARDAIVLAVANLYLDAVAGTSRIEAAEAEVNTAKALFDQATDMKQAGTVAGIDVLRAQVQYETEQQQLIVLRNDLAKQKLALARAIGIDPRQPIELSERVGYRAIAPMSIDEATNRALEGVPADKVRFHTCYGINEGPRLYEAALSDIIDYVLKINAGSYSFEAANPRHEHEYHLFERVKVAEGKVLCPGVITHASNIVEHPELIAERIIRFARLVGRENVIAGADCGFSSQALYTTEVHPTVVWAKFKAMRQGADLATEQLWGEAGGDWV